MHSFLKLSLCYTYTYSIGQCTLFLSSLITLEIASLVVGLAVEEGEDELGLPLLVTRHLHLFARKIRA